MADLTIAAVLREGKFSPNHIANDAAILHDSAAELRRKGFVVNVYSEAQFEDAEVSEDIVLAMCRGQKAVDKLQRLEDAGVVVVNSGYGIENCIRMFMVPLLRDAGVPIPKSILVETDVDVRRRLRSSGFGAARVKIADDHLHHLEDICRCRHAEEVQEILHEFFFRKIRKAVVSESIEGTRVRFYGVASIGWFHCFMPFAAENDGLAGGGGPDDLETRICEICMRAAEVLRVDIFGGDMVVTPGGECLIVNFDDWPSFAPIRKEASKAIAKSVLRRARKLISMRKRI